VRRIGELAHRMLQRTPAKVLRLRPLHHGQSVDSLNSG
jgi:actin-like ATPase involved in cell morphogenesis